MFSLRRLIAIFLALTLLTSLGALTGCGSGVEAEDTYQKAITLARTEIWEDINTGKSSSASVAIMDNGKIVYAEGLGMADREKSIAADTSTRYNIGSVSKAFCAAAILILVDEGKVKLDSPVTEYLPDFTMADPRYKNITVRMLLDHTSGIPGTTETNNFGYSFNSTVYEDTLANLSRAHLNFDPGSEAPYTNDGFTLAEIVVVRVSGQSFVDFLTDKIFKPLAMKDSGASVGMLTGEKVGNLYKLEDGKALPVEVLSIVGAGGLSSTASDLVRFADSFSGKGKQILSPSSITEMTKSSPSPFARQAIQASGINPEFQYGLGLDITRLPDYEAKGIQVIGKGGDTFAYHSMLLADPQHRVSVAVIEAGLTSSSMKITADIFKSVMQQKGLLEIDEPQVTLPPAPQKIPESYAAFAGFYAPGTKISFDSEMMTCLTTSYNKGIEVRSNTMTYRDGSFYTPAGNRCVLLAANDQHCLLIPLPGLELYMVMGQKIPEIAQPLSLKIDMNGKQWLKRNNKPFESVTLSRFFTSSTYDFMPGYIDFGGWLKVESPESAVPVCASMRDQKELTLLEKDGQTWAQLGDCLLSPASDAPSLKTGENSLKIGLDGYSEWFRTEAEAILSFERPEGARVIVHASSGAELYDSIKNKGDVYAPAGSFVMIAGNSGDTFNVTVSTN